MSSDTQAVACYCPIQTVTVSTHSLWLLATYIIPCQFSVVPREKSRVRLGSKPSSQRRVVKAGWRNILWQCDAPGWNHSRVSRGEALKAQPVLPISVRYWLVSFCQALGGFIQSEDPALKEDVFVIIGDTVGDYFHPALAYLILLWFIYLCLYASKPQMNSCSYKTEGLW